LFDDVSAFRSLREVMGALLRSYPSPKIWIAECTSAEEVFSLAILLEEAGILDKTLIYATCSNQALLEEVRKGSFDAGRLPEYESNYRRGGGAASFSDYWSRDGERAVFVPKLAHNITWSQYNLVTDTSFNEFQIIVCRNRLFDFDAMLRHRVLALFGDSLAQFGLLCTDRVSELHTVPFSLNYTPVFVEHGIYRRT
jgi:chemotaxis protein methyltransferase CheR